LSKNHLMRKTKVTAVFIALNAEATLENFINSFPKKLVDEMILVDDKSSDGTYELAKKLHLLAYQNPVRLGYGGNLKRALRLALARGADIIVDIHPDGEYKPLCIPKALAKVREGADLVLGNRFSSPFSPLQNGMRIWKLIPIAFLNRMDRFIFGPAACDFHQGFRVYTRNLLTRIDFLKNSNDYLFSFEIIAQAAWRRMRIEQVPVETCYRGRKRGASLVRSIKYALGTFWVRGLYLLARAGFHSKLFKA